MEWESVQTSKEYEIILHIDGTPIPSLVQKISKSDIEKMDSISLKLLDETLNNSIYKIYEWEMVVVGKNNTDYFKCSFHENHINDQFSNKLSKIKDPSLLYISVLKYKCGSPSKVFPRTIRIIH